MQRHLTRLFHVLLFAVPFIFTAFNDELFEFNKMMAVYALTTIIAVLWCWRMVQEKRLIFRSTLLTIPLILFLATQTLSTFFSIHVNTSIFGYYSRFHGGLLSTITYLVLYFAAVSNLRKSDIIPLIRTTLLSALGVALYAIPEHFGVSPSCILITGEFTASCWVQDVQTRVFATFGQPNWLAAYFTMLLPFSLWLFLAQTGQKVALWKRYLPLVSGVLMTYALLYTRSRSGFVALAGSIFVLSIGWIERYLFSQKTELTKKPLFLALIFLPLFIGLIAGTPFSPNSGEVLNRTLRQLGIQKTESSPTELAVEGQGTSPTVSTTALESGGTDSSKIREIVWTGAIAVWKRYPLLGSGPETFAYSYYLDRLQEHNLISEWDFLYNKAHNEYLNTLATTGALGLASLLAILGTITARCLQLWSEARRDQLSPVDTWLPIVVGASIFASIITNFFGFSTVMVAVFTFLFPAFLEVWQVAKEEPAKVHTSTKSFVKKGQGELELNLESDWIISGLVGLAGIFVLFSIAGMWSNDYLLAQAKANMQGGDALTGYQQLELLTRRAPHEAVFWNEKSTALAQITVANAPKDATLGAQLIQETLASSDRTVELNPVHINYWKSRARVFLLLSTLDQKYLAEALQTLQKAHELSPTDSKITYNIALVYESLQKGEEAELWYKKTLDLRPIYEEARQSYAKFLEGLGDYEAAIEQYRYVTENLNPGDLETRQHWEMLQASHSAQIKPEL